MPTIWPFVSKSQLLKVESQYNELNKQYQDLNAQVRGGVNIPGELLNSLLDSERSTKASEETSLNLSAFYAGLNILCDSLNIPIGVYKRETDGDRMPVTASDPYEFKVYRLLHTSPNMMHTPSQWIALMEASRIIYGNGYSLILRNNIGEPTALQWIHPGRVDVKSDGKLRYDIRKEDNTSLYLRNVPALDMIHVKGFCRDGVIGQGVLEFAAESLGFGLATQKSGNKFFADGMTSKYVMSHPGSLGGPGGIARKNLQDSAEAEIKKKSIMILEEGIKIYTLSIPPEQAQFLESRKFSVTEISRWLNIPEFMLANNDPTYSNIENFALHFVTHNVRPRVRMYEQEFNWKLLTNAENFYTEFNMNSLLRANITARAQFYVQMVQNGIMSRNECRAFENLNKIDGGDEFLTPLNLATDSERKKAMEPEP